MFLDTLHKYRRDRTITLENIAILDYLVFFRPHSTVEGGGLGSVRLKFNQKVRLSNWVRRGRPTFFRGETTLVGCFFSRGWIMVKVQ